MSLSADGGVLNVLSSTVVSHRASTPSKIPTRSGTPQRAASAPRATSNSKRELVSSDLYYDSSIIQRAPARSTSRKKQRQWENKTLFGLDQFKMFAEQQSQFLDDLDSDQLPQLEIKWKSTLSELLKPENQHVLKEFLNCKESEFEIRKKRKIDLSSCIEWKVAELGWLNIERKVRLAIGKAFCSSESIRAFLRDVELVVLHFAHFDSVVDKKQLSDELLKDLLQPLKVDSFGNLQVPLCDSPFRRMLLHGVVQFYGLRSKSVVLSKKGGVKVMIIMKPKHKITTAGSEEEVENSTEGKEPANIIPSFTSSSAPVSSAVPSHATAARCISLTQYLSYLLAEDEESATEEQGLQTMRHTDENDYDDVVNLESIACSVPYQSQAELRRARRDLQSTASLSIRDILLNGVENITAATAQMNLTSDYVLV